MSLTRQKIEAARSVLKARIDVADRTEIFADNLDANKVIDALCDLALSALDQERLQPVEWLPIETAPKDGTRIILAWGGASVVGYYLDNSGYRNPWKGWRTPSMEPTPRGLITHWMPLPATPLPNADAGAGK